MPAYVIVMVTVDDPEMYRKYTDRTPPTIARYGGRFLARGEGVQTLEGEPYEGRLVLLEFPTPENAADWFNDPDYQSAAEFRRAAAAGRFLLIDGESTRPTRIPRYEQQ